MPEIVAVGTLQDGTLPTPSASTKTVPMEAKLLIEKGRPDEDQTTPESPVKKEERTKPSKSSTPSSGSLKTESSSSTSTTTSESDEFRSPRRSKRLQSLHEEDDVFQEEKSTHENDSDDSVGPRRSQRLKTRMDVGARSHTEDTSHDEDDHDFQPVGANVEEGKAVKPKGPIRKPSTLEPQPSTDASSKEGTRSKRRSGATPSTSESVAVLRGDVYKIGQMQKKIEQTQEEHGKLLERQNNLLEALLQRGRGDVKWKVVQDQELQDLEGEREMKVEVDVDVNEAVETETRDDESEEEELASNNKGERKMRERFQQRLHTRSPTAAAGESALADSFPPQPLKPLQQPPAAAGFPPFISISIYIYQKQITNKLKRTGTVTAEIT